RANAGCDRTVSFVGSFRGFEERGGPSTRAGRARGRETARSLCRLPGDGRGACRGARGSGEAAPPRDVPRAPIGSSSARALIGAGRSSGLGGPRGGGGASKPEFFSQQGAPSAG